jgi:hypothetical protein
VKPEDLLNQFRNSYDPRIAVTVDMIATGTDVKPLECLVFMRNVKSLGYFEQMKGRGCRIVSPDELTKVTPDAKVKTHFVIVDCVGVCEEEKSATKPLDREPSVPLDKLLDLVSKGVASDDLASSIASKLVRLDQRLDDNQREMIEEASGGRNLQQISAELLTSIDPDKNTELAKAQFSVDEPSEDQVAKVERERVAEALKTFHQPKLREAILGARRSLDQVIDEQTPDVLLKAGFSEEALLKARTMLTSFKKFIEDNKDEIEAIKILYSRPYRAGLRFKHIKELATKLNQPPFYVDPSRPESLVRLWQAYELTEPEKVKGKGGKQLVDVVALVKHALDPSTPLAPMGMTVEERYQEWLGEKEKAGITFTVDQKKWLDAIKDHIASSLAIEQDDLEAVSVVPMSCGDHPLPFNTMSEGNGLPGRRRLGDRAYELIHRWRDHPRSHATPEEIQLDESVSMEVPNMRFWLRMSAICGTSPTLGQCDFVENKVSKGVNQAMRLAVPIAPLPEQHRIVEKIEELFSDLDAGVASLERAKANLKRYRASVLKSAVEGRLSEEWRREHPQAEDGQMLLDRILRERREKWEKDQLLKFKEKGKEPPKNWEGKYEEPSAPDTSGLPELPDGWAWATVEHCSFVDVGFAFKSSEFADEGIRLLRGENMEPGALRWKDVRYWPTDKVDGYEHLLLTEGDIVLAMDRPLVSAGLKIARAKETDLPALLVQRMARFRVMTEVNTAFLFVTMQAQRFITHLLGEQQGTQLPHISCTSIQEFPVPLPPLAEQEQIVALVEERLSQIDSAEKTIDSELVRSKRLRQSILKRAFEGKLVPQDPKDEPASVLLERIKASREQEQPKKANRAKARAK